LGLREEPRVVWVTATGRSFSLSARVRYLSEKGMAEQNRMQQLMTRDFNQQQCSRSAANCNTEHIWAEATDGGYGTERTYTARVCLFAGDVFSVAMRWLSLGRRV